jgi:hypothetical protein
MMSSGTEAWKRYKEKVGYVPITKEGSMEKEGVDPLTIAGLGALSHFGANLAVKAGHGTKLLRGVRAGRMAKGLRSGIEGTPQGVGSRIAETWVGPELIAGEHVGRRVGGLLRGRSRGQQTRALKKLRKAVAMNPELQKAPFFEDVVPGVNRALEGGLPKEGPIRQAGFLRRAAPAALAPIVGAIEPAALVHAGVNVARKAVATSKSGREFMATGAEKGLLRSAMETGEKARIGKLREILMDTLVSPAALHTERMGQAIGHLASEGPAATEKLKRLAGAMHTIMGQKRVAHTIGKTKADLQSFMERAPISVPAPVRPSSTLLQPAGVRW